MKSGKVIVSDLSGSGNKIYHAGDQINEEQVPRGIWDKLVKGGYIKEDPKQPQKPAEVKPPENKK